MNPMKYIPQADEWLPTGVRRYIGGVRTYGQRLNFYLGVMNTATLMILAYQNVGLVRSLFPSLVAWLGFVAFVLVPGIIAFDYVLMHPSQITYNSHQQARSSRNPAFELIEENNRMLRENAARADGGDETEGGEE